MTTDSEKRLLKEFLDAFDTNKLCEIVRSVFHGGGVAVNTREDAELLLLSQPCMRILSSKKTPVSNLLKFLISKGFMPTPQMTKTDLCLAFKSLIECQPDYVKPIQQMPVANNILALTQNNNMMHPQLYQVPIQHLDAPLSVTGPVSKSKIDRKEHENELLEEFIEMFAKHFYDLFNDLDVPNKDQLDGRHFYENCTMAVRILGGSEEINENCENSLSILQCLLGIKKEHQLFFSPHLGDGVKWKKELHGLVKVHIGGTLHQGVGRMVGMFEQQFVLREDPQAANTWKILNTNLIMKSMDSLSVGPSLSIQDTQRNNLQIDIV